MDDIRRVLLVRFGSLGDVLHALPALATLKCSFPGWEVDWLVESRWRPLLEGNPYLSRVTEVDTLAWRHEHFSRRVWDSLGSVTRELRSRHYDWALDLQGALKSALACRLSGARAVIGFERPWLREPGASVFYTRRVQPTAVHVVEANLALVASLGARKVSIEFPLPSGDERQLPTALLQEAVAVVNPGAGWPAKQWSVDGYAQLCDTLEETYLLPVALNCGPGEERLAKQVQRACKRSDPVIYSGALPGLIALLRRARILVAPDTGPLHLAAALGVPTVGLFGPTDPRRNGPYGDSHRVLRPAGALTSHNHSAKPGVTQRIQLAEVLQAVRDLLDAQGIARAGLGSRVS
jgi:heptosyltransferase-1